MSVLPIQEILDYINQARMNPKKFSQYIKKELDSFLNQQSLPLYPGCNYQTNQGKSAWEQAYKFVKDHKPLPPFKLHEGLNLAAMDHAIDMQKNNFSGHTSSDKTSMRQRIERRCGKLHGQCAQIIASQFDIKGRNNSLQTVMSWIIDDGVPQRGHRKSIYSDQLKFVGIYSVKIGDQYETCVDLLSEDLKTIQPSKNPLTLNLTGKVVKDILPSTNTKKKVFQNHTPHQFQNKHSVYTKQLQGKERIQYKQLIVSNTTQTMTLETVNGKTTQTKITKTTYSNGNTQQRIEKTIF